MGDTGVVFGAFGYLVVVAFLLGLAGFGDATVELPTAPGQQEGAVEQTFIQQAIECVITFLSDCSSKTETKVFGTITDLVAFGVGVADIFFQLLTFQIPEIPSWLNAIILFPPGSALGFVALKFVRGIGG